MEVPNGNADYLSKYAVGKHCNEFIDRVANPAIQRRTENLFPIGTDIHEAINEIGDNAAVVVQFLSL